MHNILLLIVLILSPSSPKMGPYSSPKFDIFKKYCQTRRKIFDRQKLGGGQFLPSATVRRPVSIEVQYNIVQRSAQCS